MNIVTALPDASYPSEAKQLSRELMNQILEIKVFPDDFLTDSNLVSLLNTMVGERRDNEFVEIGLRSLNHLAAKSPFAVGCILELSPTAEIQVLFAFDSPTILILAYRLILLICDQESGCQFVVQTPTFGAVCQAIHSLLAGFATEPHIPEHAMLGLSELLNIVGAVCYSYERGIRPLLPMIVRVVEEAFDFLHSRDIHNHIVRILLRVASAELGAELCEHIAVIARAIHLLDDARNRPTYRLVIQFLAQLLNVGVDTPPMVALDDLLSPDLLHRVLQMAGDDQSDNALVADIIDFLVNFVVDGSESLAMVLACEGSVELLCGLADEGGAEVQRRVRWLFWSMVSVATGAQMEAVMPSIEPFLAGSFFPDDTALLATGVRALDKVLMRATRNGWAESQWMTQFLEDIVPQLKEMALAADEPIPTMILRLHQDYQALLDEFDHAS
jgi:hypothetical protein